MSAIEDVAAERRRQIEVEGFGREHDDKHADGELAAAAACYALGSPLKSRMPAANTWAWEQSRKMVWPWGLEWWKPKDRRRNLVRAAALLLAEIERLDRAAELESRADAERAQEGPKCTCSAQYAFGGSDVHALHCPKYTTPSPPQGGTTPFDGAAFVDAKIAGHIIGIGPLTRTMIIELVQAAYERGQAGAAMPDREFLRALVDHVWSTSWEDQSVPSTEWADQMIDHVIALRAKLSEKP